MVSMQTVSCLEKVWPSMSYGEEKRGSKLQNEHYAFQLIVEGGEDVQGAVLSVSDDCTSFVELYRVQNVPAVKPYGKDPDLYVLASPTGEYPDLLLPLLP